MLKINVKIDRSGFDRRTKAFEKQVRFAAAGALNQTARLAASQVNAEMPSIFKKANAFTQRAVWAPPGQAAKRNRLTAWVAVRPLQAKYLKFEEFGGVRTPADNTRIVSKALILPAQAAKRSQSGNLPYGYVRRLAQQAQMTAAGRAAAATSTGRPRRRRASASLGIVKLTGAGPGGRGPGGFFMRTAGHRLVRLISFGSRAHYRPKFGFGKRVRTVVRASFPKIMKASLTKALASVK